MYGVRNVCMEIKTCKDHVFTLLKNLFKNAKIFYLSHLLLYFRFVSRMLQKNVSKLVPSLVLDCFCVICKIGY